MRGIFAGIILLLLLAVLVTPRTVSASPLADYSVDLTQDPISVAINLQIFQNLTSLMGTFVLPQLHSVIEGANSTDLQLGVESALRLKTSQAQVSNARLVAESTAWSNQTNLQWFNVSLNFSVRGIRTETGGVTSIDMSWKSFSVTSDILVGGVEANNLGATYLVGVAREIAEEQSGSNPSIQVVFIANARQVTSAKFPDAVSRIAIFNFTSLATPLSKWQSPFVALAKTRTWSFKGPDLGMSYSRTFREPEGDTHVGYGLFYTFQARIAASSQSSATGDLITITQGSSSETLMGVTILSVAVLGSVTYLYERHLLNDQGKRKPKR